MPPLESLYQPATVRVNPYLVTTRHVTRDVLEDIAADPSMSVQMPNGLDPMGLNIIDQATECLPRPVQDLL